MRWYGILIGMMRSLFFALIVLMFPLQQGVSAQAQAQGLGSLSEGNGEAFERMSPQEKVLYFDRLSDDQKVKAFQGLGSGNGQRLFAQMDHADQVWIFENLSEDERRRIFEQLSVEQKIGLYTSLSETDKRKTFNGLTNTEKQAVFAGLDDIERRRLFRVLDAPDKRMLLESLDQSERQEWLQRYPELTELSELPEAPPKGLEEAPPTEALSDIERVLSGQFPSTISGDLKQFGYGFFNGRNAQFSPVNNVPVGEDYVVGPGDGFKIHLWGKTENTYDVQVTRDGRIVLPRLGTVEVSGLTFEELKGLLYRKFREYYPDFEMSITMGALRSVDVFVVGEARNPGTYTVSALSTVITALYAAGGPAKTGSLRTVKVFRNGASPKEVDLYDFFARGRKDKDIRLQPGDSIFVPMIGPVVGIAGCVKRPAIYELRGEQTIGELIDLAGGILPLGYLQNVVLERISGHERRVVKSFNLDPGHSRADINLTTPLKDFDLIRIYPVHHRLHQVVYLEGHVKYPREYELKPAMRLRDLLPSHEHLLPEPHLEQGEIIRLVPPDLHPEIVSFNLGAMLAGDEGENLLLQDMDRVIVYDAWEKREKPTVSIRGSVRRPGSYRLYRGMTLKDLIFKAGNLTEDAFLEVGSLTRVVPGKQGTETVKIPFSPRSALTGMKAHDIALKNHDTVYIRGIPQFSQALGRKVYLEGEFLFPGEYAFSEGERVSSLIERAGGVTGDAYPFGAVFQRDSVRTIQDKRLKEYVNKLEQDILTMTALSAETALDKEEAAILKETMASKKALLAKLRSTKSTGRMVIRLEEVLELQSSEYNFELRSGDRLIVPKKPDTVNVLGEVFNPTALLAENGKTLGYYMNLVGGMTDAAEEGQVYVVKADGTVVSKSQGGWFGLGSWDGEEKRWTLGGFEDMKMHAGDTIIVPKQVELYPWLRLTKDITQIMYQIATAAGVLIVAF